MGTDGLVSDWNREHQASQLRLNDRVVRVNGVGGTVKSIVAEISSARYLEMAIRRQGQAVQNTSVAQGCDDPERVCSQGRTRREKQPKVRKSKAPCQRSYADIVRESGVNRTAS